MSTLESFLCSSLYFYSFAAMLVMFFWDYIRIPKWLFLIAVLCSRFVVTSNVWFSNVFASTHLSTSFFYAIISMITAMILLFFTVKVPFTLILYSVFMTSFFAFFMKGMEIWLFSPTEYTQYSRAVMYEATIMYICLSVLVCIFIRLDIVPLFRICQDYKVWFRLAVPPFLGSIGYWLLFTNVKPHTSSPCSLFLGSLILFITLLYSNGAGVHSIRISLKATKYETEAKVAENLLNMQKEHYMQLLDSISETRMTRHDMRHHMHTIAGLVEQENIPALKEYLSQYEDSIPEAAFYTGHPGVDAILGHLFMRAKNDHIDVICNNLTLPATGNIKDTELTVIFGNCVENAIEASLAVPVDQRYIKIHSSYQGNCLALIFENAYAGTIEKDNEQYLSSKRNKKAPGTGLLSLKHIVEHYHGNLEVHYENQTFCIMLLLYFDTAVS